jgi:hypothetical protein
MTRKEQHEMRAMWARLDNLEQIVNIIVGRLEIDLVAEAVTDEELVDRESEV